MLAMVRLSILLAFCLPIVGSAQMLFAVDATNNYLSLSDRIEAHRWQTNLVIWMAGMNDSRASTYAIGDSSLNRIDFAQTNSSARPVWSNTSGGGSFNFTSDALYDGDALDSVWTTGVFSVCAWINPSSLTTATAVIICKYSDSTVDAANASRQFNFSLNTNRLRFLIADTNGSNFASWNTIPAITQGVPVHVGVVLNTALSGTNRARLFLNGQQVATYSTLTNAVTMQNGSAKLSVGAMVNMAGAQGNYFPGMIADVRAFSVAVDAVVQESYSNGVARR